MCARTKTAIAIGACTRQCLVERDALVKKSLPLLAQTMPFIGHAATRARGTIGGSLAHADPAAELPLIAVTLDAVMTYRLGGADGELAARDFFSGLMMTALPAGACLTSVRFPVWQGENRIGVGFHEVNARRSDFAFVAAAAQVALDGDGKAKRIALGIGAATDTPLRLDAVEKELTGGTLDEKQVTEAVRAALSRCRDAERPACLGRLSPPRRGRARRARHRRRQGAKLGERPCALSSRSTARNTRSRSRSAPRCSIACAIIWRSKARMPAASTACAAPAPCCSTAWRCARA